MDVSGEAVGAMQAYLRLKRYILPSGIVREALQAAAPFLQVQPSAARELALEALKTAHASMEGSCSANHRIALNTVDAAIRALSSPDYADADHAQARDVLARFRDYVIEGITAGTIMRGGEHHNPIWQEVAGVLHADAGKVEGDGWPTGEYEVDYEVICNGEWVAGSTDLNDAEHYAAVYSHDGEIEIVEARTYRRPLPSAPASEGAE